MTSDTGSRTPSEPATQTQQDEEQQRPDGVVLLFDRQRPGVAQRRGQRELVEVRLAGEHRPPVGHVADGGEGIVADSVQLQPPGEEHGVERRRRGA